MDPKLQGGPSWTPISPETGSLFHADPQIVDPLHRRQEEDRRQGRERSECRYFAAGDLARDLAITKQAAAMDVKRVRQALAELYAAVSGVPPREPLLIETGDPRGYRIDPDTRFLASPPARDDDR